MNNKLKSRIVAVAAASCITMTAEAHLPTFEGERVRNDNHFTKTGFAAPVRGECDITAVGPTDPKAGSANEFLGEQNSPPNFFCSIATQDDWNFEHAVENVERLRVPQPDAADLGMPLEEGYA